MTCLIWYHPISSQLWPFCPVSRFFPMYMYFISMFFTLKHSVYSSLYILYWILHFTFNLTKFNFVFGCTCILHFPNDVRLLNNTTMCSTERNVLSKTCNAAPCMCLFALISFYWPGLFQICMSVRVFINFNLACNFWFVVQIQMTLCFTHKCLHTHREILFTFCCSLWFII